MRTLQRRYRAVTVLTAMLTAIALFGCAKAPPTLSPAGAAAFQATRVVKALDVLRDFAIEAEAQNPKVLSTANTRKVVTFHESAVKTIGAVPGGWKPTVTAGLDQLQHDVSAADWQRVVPYVNLIKALIAGVQ
jgi:hypothetical protein